MDSTVGPPPAAPMTSAASAIPAAGTPRTAAAPPGPHPGAGPEPAPPAAAVPGLGDWPVRPRSPGVSRRARRRALRMRIARAAAVFAVAAGLFATVALAAAPSRTTSGPPPPPVPDTPLPRVTTPPIPLAPVGVDGKAWVQYQGWCVGDITPEGDVIGAETCRFLPEPGRIDVTVLKPGRYAPPDHSLVVVVVVGQAWPRLGYEATMSDLDSSNAMVLDRPAGLLGVVFFWGYTRGGQVDITVTNADGAHFASCHDCALLDN
ncbi:hypothetical protein LO772_20785 [Yinghuangia sp. ASG 101]|uniref:hypothetical protein n=1 Tax=Yinghuangia sp. ASG 101 TaxID=2896848 RepID=UPI001E42A486|nr:hypothetical protein [Yinghuangia sp. ASG 101]UGQ09371.1 hypothetical protein LO772_20785 [Yinghuangia sp. ASG 101]